MLSIIIPTLNEEKYLPKLLQSIKEQTFSDYEIIVSDACSEDSTTKIAENFSCRVVVSNRERRHPSIQRNAGAKIAQGDMLIFFDADTGIIGNDFLEKVIDEFNQRNLGIAGFYLLFDSNKFFYRFYRRVYNFVVFCAQYFKPMAVGAGIITYRKWHEQVGGFDESLFIGEDQVYCESISKLSKFRILKSKKTFFSVRRFEKFGPWKMFANLVYSVLYVLIFGPIKKRIIKYEFGKW